MEGRISVGKKQEMIASFMEIAAGQTPEVAIQFLQAANWNLEEALQLLFVGHGRGVSAPSLHAPVVANPSSLPGNIAVPNDVGGGEDEVRPPLPVVRETLYGNPMLSAGAPWIRNRRRDPRLRFFSGEMRHPGVPESAEGATSAAANKPQDFDPKYRRPFHLMFQGSFEQAKSSAAVQDKWLLVNVQSKKQLDSLKLNLATWTNEAVCQMINTNFIFWQVYDHKSEGKKVCTFYKLDSIPVVLVIDPITGEKMKSWCGMLEPVNLLEDLVQFIDVSPTNHHSTHSRKRLKGSDSVSHKNKAVPNEEDEVQKAIAAPLEGVEDPSPLASNDIEAATSNKVEEPCASKLPSYPPLPEEPQGDKSLLCGVGLRLPDGRRIQRNFLKSDPIQLLWSFCFAQLGEAGTRPFRLTQAIPGAKSLDYESKTTMAESGLANSMIIVAWD